MNLTKQKYDIALRRRQSWDSLLADAYKYAYPQNEGSSTASRTIGEDRNSEIFDSTAVTAVYEKRMKLHGLLFPPFEEWIDFDSSSNRISRQGWNKYIDKTRNLVRRAIDEASNFHIAVNSAMGDALISTGCIIVNKGTAERPLSFEAIPANELIPFEESDGLLKTIFRRREIVGAHIKQLWEGAELPDDLARKIEDKPFEFVKIIEAFLGNIHDQGCSYQLWIDGRMKEDDKPIYEYEYISSPIIAFRMDRHSGEWMGRGPVLSVLPDIKTANKFVELTLKNAYLAVTGAYQAEDDGVLNPALVHLKPGVIIPIAQGSKGLIPIQTSARFDISQLTLNEIQDRIRSGIMGPSLPPIEDNGRTATEMHLRHAEHQKIELPASLRILNELAKPLINRIIHILTLPEMADSPYFLEPFKDGDQIINPIPRSPVIRARKQAEANQTLQILGMIKGISPELPIVFKEEQYMREALSHLGIGEEFINTEQESNAIKQAMQDQAQAAALQAQKAG